MANDPTVEVKGQTCRSTYWSMDQFVGHVLDNPSKIPAGYHEDEEWYGGTFTAVAEAMRDGWEAELPEALDVAEGAVKETERELPAELFTPQWDVCGADVDMGRYLTGEPENMIDFPLAPMVKQGKVVTVCASFGALGGVSAEAKIAQGRVVTALAMTLGQLGYTTELWADYSGRHAGRGQSTYNSIRVLVKGANDVIDPSKILAAYAHPGAQRRMGFVAMSLAPAPFNKHGLGNQSTRAPKQDLPEGTIYLPQPEAEWTDTKEHVLRLLREAGILG